MNKLQAVSALFFIGTLAWATKPEAQPNQAPSVADSSSGVPTASVAPAIEGASLPTDEAVAVVVPEPVLLPETTAEEVMESLQSVYVPTPDVVADPVDIPTTNDEQGYLTTTAIRAWLREHSGGRSWSYSGGNYGAPLRNHLIRTHGWRESQLLPLSDSELRQLHSADHNGQLSPRSEPDLTLTLASASDEGVPVWFNTADDYWWWTHEGKNYRWHTLREGETYGGRFVFVGGRMCPNGQPAATAPTPAATVTRERTVTRSYSGSNCPNGQCGNQRYRARSRWRW